MTDDLKCLGTGFDKHHTVPINSTAVNVVFRKGVHYDPELKPNTTLNQDCPHEMHVWEKIPPHILKDPNFIDYRGRRFGCFTVIGLLFGPYYNTWVLRCCCGQYEIRRTTTLNKPITNIQQTRCGMCMDLERIRHQEYFNKHGQYPWDTGKRGNRRRKNENNGN